MSPTPLIELQRRLAEAGRIRMGEKGDKGQPQRLSTWRITSPDHSLVEQAAGLYGGEPKPWDSPTGQQFEVVTTSAELPVLVMPGYSFHQGYEFRTSPTKVERRCDGVELDDGQPCICNAEGFEGDTCALLTRLTVALPELTTMLGWRLETKGDNAARELLASMDLVRGVSGGRPFVPAKLKVVERRGNVNGQAVRYVVPVIDVQVRYAEVLGSADPAVHTYVALEPPANGLSLEQGLELAEKQTATRTARSAAPIPAADDIEFGGAPTPPDDSEVPSPPASANHAASGASEPLPGNTLAATTRDKPLTASQKKKLGMLVGKLRDDQQVITTPWLYKEVADIRHVDLVTMGGLYPDVAFRDENRVLHFGPLMGTLTRSEASTLIDRMEAVAAA